MGFQICSPNLNQSTPKAAFVFICQPLVSSMRLDCDWWQEGI